MNTPQQQKYTFSWRTLNKKFKNALRCYTRGKLYKVKLFFFMKDNLLSFVSISNKQYYTKIWHKDTHLCKLGDQKFDFPIDFVHGCTVSTCTASTTTLHLTNLNECHSVLPVYKLPPCKLVFLLINLLALIMWSHDLHIWWYQRRTTRRPRGFCRVATLATLQEIVGSDEIWYNYFLYIADGFTE